MDKINYLPRIWVLRNLYRLPPNFESFFSAEEMEEMKQEAQLELRSLEQQLEETKHIKF